jgi:hypothetical protein
VTEYLTGHSSEGLCNTPKLGEVDREAGEYMEMRFFGGIVRGAFDMTTKDIKDEGLAKGDDFYSVGYVLNFITHYHIKIQTKTITQLRF